MKHPELMKLAEKHNCSDCENVLLFGEKKRCGLHSFEVYIYPVNKYKYISHYSSENMICQDWIEQQEFKLTRV